MAEGSPKVYEKCVLTRLDNGIYFFETREGSRAAADEFLAQIEALFRENEGGPKLRLLYDFSKGIFPLNYIMPHIRVLFATQTNRPGTRSAVMMDGGLVSLVDGLFKLLGTQNRDNARFFKPGMREAAIEWLLSGD